MKRFKINFGIITLVVASVVAFSTKAPAKKRLNVFGYDYANSQWIADGTAGYVCVEDEELICKFEFATAPESTETPEDNTGSPVSDSTGSYQNP